MPNMEHVRDTPFTPHYTLNVHTEHSWPPKASPQPPGSVHRWGNQGTKLWESGGLASPQEDIVALAKTQLLSEAVLPAVKWERG